MTRSEAKTWLRQLRAFYLAQEKILTLLCAGQDSDANLLTRWQPNQVRGLWAWIIDEGGKFGRLSFDDSMAMFELRTAGRLLRLGDCHRALGARSRCAAIEKAIKDSPEPAIEHHDGNNAGATIFDWVYACCDPRGEERLAAILRPPGQAGG